MIGHLTENSQLRGTLTSGGSSIQYEAGTGIDITDNVISNTITKTSALENDAGYITNKYEEYSTNETRVGTWVDGKPIYRKCFIITDNFGFDFTIEHNIANFGELINMGGSSFSAGSYKPLPSIYMSNVSNYGVSIYAITDTLVEITLGNWARTNVSKIIFWLDYTKSNE